MNGTRSSAASKRKAAGSPAQGPPPKRPVNGRLTLDDDHTDEELDVYDDDSVLSVDLDAHAAMFIGTPGSLGEWQDTIQKVVRNVVAIRFCQTCSFDTDSALTSEATGFVVDAERG